MITAQIIQFVPRPNPNRPQSESLLAQATSLVGFINGLTAKDQTPDFSQAGAYHAPDGDSA